ncbi:NTP transferase domain-containing protein [Candidatus Woesearchaeota archaeon]|nr:NTP transferase domain-containing protein [Candidatus Woesearchaeota archaeon]
MKAVILAAGKSTRTYPLTIHKPKPMLKVGNKTLLEHNLEQLVDIIDEAVIIVGFHADKIKQHLGENYESIKLTYIDQKEQLGTGHALLQAEPHVKGERFIVLMGDDLYFRGDMRKCLRYPLSVLVKRVENYGDFGVFIQKEDKVLDIIEKPEKFISDIANTAFYVFNEKIFESIKKCSTSERGEVELTEAFRFLALKEDIFSVEAQVWLPIVYPWSLLEADQIVRDEDVKVGENSEIIGKVFDCSIGNNCKIEGFVKNSIIGDNVHIHRDAVVEDSIIGDNVNFVGTIKTRDKVEMKMKGKTVEVINFGAVIGDGADLQNVLLQPGTMVWPGVKKEGVELKGLIEK